MLAGCTSVSAAGLGGTSNTGTLSNICHATGDPANPYEEMTLTNDIYPVPADGCPASAAVITNGQITICHATGNETNPYTEITVSANGLNGHGTHVGDIITSPETGCPTVASPVATNSTDKITICHATGSKKNPYNEITISINGLNGHNGHKGDIIPVPADGCPK
jgi:hypothetical protein